MYLHFLIFYYYYDVRVGGRSCGCPAKIFHARCSQLFLLTNNTIQSTISYWKVWVNHIIHSTICYQKSNEIIYGTISYGRVHNIIHSTISYCKVWVNHIIHSTMAYGKGNDIIYDTISYVKVNNTIYSTISYWKVWVNYIIYSAISYRKMNDTIDSTVSDWKIMISDVTGAPCREVNSKVATAPNTQSRR